LRPPADDGAVVVVADAQRADKAKKSLLISNEMTMVVTKKAITVIHMWFSGGSIP
jgi:hypothetical protein